MIKKLTLGIASLALMFVFTAPSADAAAIPAWNVSGVWNISFDYLGTPYLHDMTLSQDGAGALTGNGGYPAGGPHTYGWIIDTGSVSGNTVHMDTHYTVGAVCTMTIDGTVATTTGAMSGIWSDNCNGARNGTWTSTSGVALPLGSLSAEDFGVINYDTGLGILKGYTAGFGLTDATFAGVQSVVIKLYAGATLLQTNTATPLVGSTILGAQISSPFDLFGTFNYVTDGYWTNVRESEYGQTLIPTRVTATVTLANGKVVTAENTLLTGDPASLFQGVVPVPTPLSPANGYSTTTVGLTKIDWTDVTDPFLPMTYVYQVSNSPLTNPDGSFVTPVYTSGPLSVSEIATPGTAAGTYYWHVKAVDSASNSSLWSTTWSVIVDNTPVVVPPTSPTNKDQCKNDGWKAFTNPSFKNQGQCVSYVNHLSERHEEKGEKEHLTQNTNHDNNKNRNNSED